MTNLIALGSKLDQLCQENLFKETALGKVLMEIEFWEGGFSRVEQVGEEVVFWVSGDNGVEDVTDLFLEMTKEIS